MGARIIFLIKSDPCESHRPAEAIRIAAGLAVSKIPVKIILSGRASLILSPEEEDIVDNDILEKFLPMIIEWKIPLYVGTESFEIVKSVIPESDEGNLKIIDNAELSELITGGNCVVF